MMAKIDNYYSLQQILNHLSQQLVDSLLPITRITSLNEMLEFALSPSTSRIAQLEGPQKVVGLFKVGSNRDDFMNQILNTLNSILSKGISDDGIIRQGNSRAIDFSITTFVDEMTDRFEIGFTVCDVRLNDLEHLLGSFGESDEDAVVDLEETEELHHLSGFGGHFVDTIVRLHGRMRIPLDTDDKDKFGLSGNV
jgi:hypothetical protein